MITEKELEMLAGLLQRAGVTNIEAVWANQTMNKLRHLVKTETARLKAESGLAKQKDKAESS